MSTLELRRKIKRQIDGLDATGLKYAANLLALLGGTKSANHRDARLAKFRTAIAKAERDVAAGRFVPFEKLRRKY